MNDNPVDILKSARNVLLIDWPNPVLPRTLLEVGLSVFCFSPGGYSRVEISPSRAELPNNGNIFPPAEGETGYLVFQKLDGKPPVEIDIVNVYRPEEEIPGILRDHILPLSAKVIWLHPPLTSIEAGNLAQKAGLLFIENTDIAAVARRIRLR